MPLLERFFKSGCFPISLFSTKAPVVPSPSPQMLLLLPGHPGSSHLAPDPSSSRSGKQLNKPLPGTAVQAAAGAGCATRLLTGRVVPALPPLAWHTTVLPPRNLGTEESGLGLGLGTQPRSSTPVSQSCRAGNGAALGRNPAQGAGRNQVSRCCHPALGHRAPAGAHGSVGRMGPLCLDLRLGGRIMRRTFIAGMCFQSKAPNYKGHSAL